MDNLEKKLEPEQIKRDFPLSDNKEWKENFNSEFNRSQNYLKSYFSANTTILYRHDRLIRNSCMNNKTVDGTGLRAADLIECINRAKRIKLI